MRRYLWLAAMLTTMGGCATYRDVKEIKMVGFDPDVSKGKSVGQFEADDCVYHVLGYWLGSYPDVSRAIANARTRKTSNVGQVIGGQAEEGGAIRYASNVTATNDGFSAVVFGKHCIIVKGMGYQ